METREGIKVSVKFTELHSNKKGATLSGLPLFPRSPRTDLNRRSTDYGAKICFFETPLLLGLVSR